jgi:hypothetical protein
MPQLGPPEQYISKEKMAEWLAQQGGLTGTRRLPPVQPGVDVYERQVSRVPEVVNPDTVINRGPIEQPPSADAPAGLSPTRVHRYTPAEERTLGGWVENFPRSYGGVVEGFTEIVKHPLQTFETVGKLVTGAVSKLSGALNDPDMDPFLKEVLRDSLGETTAEGLVGMLEERYGSWDSVRNTAYQDPVGFAADLAGLVSGAGAALRVPGVVSKTTAATRAAQLGRAAGKYGRKYDPINITGRSIYETYRFSRAGLGKGGETVIGLTTGAGPLPINVAFNKPGSRVMKDIMRSKASEVTIVENVREGLQKMAEFRADAYQGALKEIVRKSGEVVMDMEPIRKAVEQRLKSFFPGGMRYVDKVDPATGQLRPYIDFKRGNVPKKYQDDVQQVMDILDEWGSEGGDLGVLGMDNLKRTLGGWYAPNSKPSNAIAATAYAAVRKELVKAVPGYSDMTKVYQDMTDMIREIEQELSAGTRRTKGATLRKLATVISRDSDYRQTLIDAIDEVTATALKEQLAGYALKDFTPATLVGRGMAMAAISGAAMSNFFAGNPAVLLMAMANSPRLVGEILIALGYARQGVQKVSPGLTVPLQIISDPALYRSVMHAPPGETDVSVDTLRSLLPEGIRPFGPQVGQ